MRVGKCVHDLGVTITPEAGFHHESHATYVWDSSGGGIPYGHLSNRASAAVSAPISFHHLTVDQLALYDRMQFAEERGEHGELYRYDFGGLLFKEYKVRDAHLKRTFKLIFGISVEVPYASSCLHSSGCLRTHTHICTCFIRACTCQHEMGL